MSESVDTVSVGESMPGYPLVAGDERRAFTLTINIEQGRTPMSKKSAFIIGCCMSIASVHAYDLDASLEWKQIAPDVYETVDANGVVRRQAFGDNGRRYDLALLRDELAQKQLSRSASPDYIATLRATISSLEKDDSSAPISQDGSVGFQGPANLFCGYVAHQLSAAWHAPSTGGSPSGATSSVVYGRHYANSNWPSQALYVSASVTPLGYPATSVNGSASITSTATAGVESLLTRTTGNQGGAFQATYSTYSSVSVSGCTNGFASLSESGTIN